jgi:hypothetical protein
MRWWISFDSVLVIFCRFHGVGYKNQRQNGEKGTKIGISRVLGVLEGIGVLKSKNPGFAHFRGNMNDLGYSYYSPKTTINVFSMRKANDIKHYPINLILSNIPYQGGEGDYRGIYDIGFKKGFYGV